MLCIWLALQQQGLHPTACDRAGLDNLEKAALSSSEAAKLLGYRRVFEPQPVADSSRPHKMAPLAHRMAEVCVLSLPPCLYPCAHCQGLALIFILIGGGGGCSLDPPLPLQCS